MFTFTDLCCCIIKNYFQLISTSTRLAIVNHAVRRIYIYSATFYRSLHWSITGFIELIMAFGSTALRIATLVFLFIARIRFPASYSRRGVLRKRYGRDLVKEVRTLEKLDFKHQKAIFDLDFLISCRKNSFLYFMFPLPDFENIR